MSTNARVGILEPDGTVTSIYIHWDGYPSHTGRLLQDHYQDVGKIRELLALGDLSSLDEEIGEDQGTDWFDQRHEILHDTKIGFFHKRDENDPRHHWSIAYGRDRGEDGIEAINHEEKNWPDYGQEYEYLYDEYRGIWFARDCYGGLSGKMWLSLEEVLDNEEDD